MSTNKRCFAFGCSYTNYIWPTASDLVGSNFDEFYNFGMSGADNTYALNRLIDVHNEFKLNSKTDYVIFGTTGHGRYTYWDRKVDWVGQGDYNFSEFCDNKKFFSQGEYSPIWAVYRSVNAIRMFKYFLSAMKIRHIIFPAIDNVHYMVKDIYKLDRKDFIPYVIEACESLEDVYDISKSLDEFMMDKGVFHDKTYFRKEKVYETHPRTEIHYDYLKQYLPQFDTDTVKSIVPQFTAKEYPDYYTLKETMAKKYELLYRNDLTIEPSLFLKKYPSGVDLRRNFRDSGI